MFSTQRIGSSSITESGFTLVEMLVALVVMSFVAILAYSAFDNLLQLEDRSKDIFLKQSRVHLAQSAMLNDFIHLRARPVRDSLGGTLDAYIAPSNEYAVEFTRGGLPNFSSMRGGLQRIGYRVEDEQLIRTVWEVVDRGPVTEKTDQVLADDIESIEVEQLNYRGEFTGVWPPVNERLSADALPYGVRVRLVLADGDAMDLLVPIPRNASTQSNDP
ncbi:MAG: type II secretion system minor pseudopilin GspJ, partial [bacterium]